MVDEIIERTDGVPLFVEEQTKTVVEACLRCGAAMEWRHQTWQCGTCGLKLGCCEGECPND